MRSLRPKLNLNAAALLGFVLGGFLFIGCTPEQPQSIKTAVPNTLNSLEPSLNPDLLGFDISSNVDDSPESVAKKFMVVSMHSDIDLLKNFSLPHDDLAILSSGVIPIPQLQEFADSVKAIEFRRLEIGESLTLPGSNQQKIVMDESHINEGKVQLVSDGVPLPMVVVKTEDGWRVDPSNIIAVRKAAQKIRQEGETE